MHVYGLQLLQRRRMFWVDDVGVEVHAVGL
jgi:hypothetical protein